MSTRVRLDPVPLRPSSLAGSTRSEEWKLDALCRSGQQSNLFFPPSTNESKEDRDIREQRAKAICQVCLVIFECRAHVLDVWEPFGVWGGLTVKERKEHLETGRPLEPIKVNSYMRRRHQRV